AEDGIRDFHVTGVQTCALPISMSYRPEEGLEQAVRRVCETAAKAVRDGKVLLILSDKDLTEGELPVNAVMATAAVHHHLVANGRSEERRVGEGCGARG